VTFRYRMRQRSYITAFGTRRSRQSGRILNDAVIGVEDPILHQVLWESRDNRTGRPVSALRAHLPALTIACTPQHRQARDGNLLSAKVDPRVITYSERQTDQFTLLAPDAPRSAGVI
jgi:hypothetical protein